jgi:hypothetical protein
MENKDELYRIDLTKEQLLLIAQTLETCSRTICGQLTTPYNKSLEHSIHIKNISFDEKMKRRDKVDELMNQVKLVIHPEQHLGASYGINYDRESDLMYEMYKTIRHRIELDNPSNSYNVFQSPPLQLTDIPFIKVKKITKDILRDENIDEILKK